jgi:hypothetical protein
MEIPARVLSRGKTMSTCDSGGGSVSTVKMPYLGTRETKRNMKFANVFGPVMGLVSAVALSVLCGVAVVQAQTVLSNETLSTTTLVVNPHGSSASCTGSSCRAKKQMFAPITITCPAVIGQTCTFHIALDATAAVSFLDEGFYQFLVDGTAPAPGPTIGQGFYLFVKFQQTNSIGPNEVSYPASVVATVTNTTSQNHTIAVGIACTDVDGDGCTANADHSTMRVDVFQP